MEAATAQKKVVSGILFGLQAERHSPQRRKMPMLLGLQQCKSLKKRSSTCAFHRSSKSRKNMSSTARLHMVSPLHFKVSGSPTPCLRLMPALFLLPNSRGCAERNIYSAISVLHSASAACIGCVLFSLAHRATPNPTRQQSNFPKPWDEMVLPGGCFCML